ncbi:MAG: hypothetical protein ACWGQW_18000, partial [bacterium]
QMVESFKPTAERLLQNYRSLEREGLAPLDIFRVLISMYSNVRVEEIMDSSLGLATSMMKVTLVPKERKNGEVS